MVKRLVGYLEYQTALSYLDRLLAIASPSELAVMEEIVRDHDEFSIFTNLSRRLEPQSTALSERSNQLGDNYERRGLGWILALARVEMGAMAAGFTDVPYPFEKFSPSPNELPHYQEVLLDSMRTHYWSMRNDPVTRNLRAGLTSDNQAIAYARRATIAIEFVKAVRSLLEKEKVITLEQRNELDKWEAQLTEIRRSILFDIIGVQSAQLVRNAPGGKSLDLAACDNRLIGVAQKELSQGTAQVKTSPAKK